MLATWGCSTFPKPTLSLDFAGATSLDDRITFTRGSQATLFDSTGTLVYAKHNLLLQSQTFQTTWSANNVSVSTDSTSAPDGTTTADTLNDGVVAAASHSLIQTPTIGVSTTYVASFFAKNVDRRYVGFAISTTSSNNYGTVEFDLNGAGAVNRTAVLGTGFAIVSSSITSVGDGWFRCVATITTGTAAVTDGRATLYLSDGAGAFDSRGRATYSGANASIYAWGAQLNLANMEGGVTSSLTTYYPTTTAAYYAPRFDYNPSTLAPLGLLIEEARTNSVSYSEQFENAFWSKTDVTVTQNAAVAPDGTLTADKLIVNNGTTGSNLNISPTFANSTPYTGSIYAKAGEWNWLEIELRSETTSILRAWFDLSNGVVGTVNAGMTATITPVGNGWYRCTATRTTAATNTSTRLRYYSTNADNSNTTGDGTSGIFIWGAQLEAGAFATSYIPTTTTALTRSADVASMTGTNFSSWYNASEGTLFAEVAQPIAGAYAVARQIAYISDNTASNRVIIFVNASATDYEPRVTNGGTGYLSSTNKVGPLGGANQPVKLALAVKQGTGEGILAAAGVLGTAGNVTTWPPSGALTQMTIGSGPTAGTQPWNGYIRRISFYPTRLPNTTLQALTA